MVNIQYLKHGQPLLGKKTRGTDGRWFQPLYSFVKEDNGEIVVRDGRGDQRLMQPHDLYTIHGTLRFMGKQNQELRKQLEETRRIIIDIAAKAVVASPEATKELTTYLRKLTQPDEEPF